MRTVYEHPDDVELVIAGSLERPNKEGVFGKTFACLVLEQMYNTRVSDRFWYERYDPVVGFTRSQLNQIRKVSLQRIICDNAGNVSRLQRNIFRLPSKIE